jgi:hypothetical protein
MSEIAKGPANPWFLNCSYRKQYSIQGNIERRQVSALRHITPWPMAHAGKGWHCNGGMALAFGIRLLACDHQPKSPSRALRRSRHTLSWDPSKLFSSKAPRRPLC